MLQSLSKLMAKWPVVSVIHGIFPEFRRTIWERPLHNHISNNSTFGPWLLFAVVKKCSEPSIVESSMNQSCTRWIILKSLLSTSNKSPIGSNEINIEKESLNQPNIKWIFIMLRSINYHVPRLVFIQTGLSKPYRNMFLFSKNYY